MGHRSAHLVAHSRFPGWTRLDIGLLLIAWLIAGLVAISGVESLRSAGAYFDTTALLAVGMATGTQVGVMYVAFRGWQARTIARIDYLEQHLPEQSLGDAKTATRISAWLTKCLIVLPILAQPLIYVGFELAKGTLGDTRGGTLSGLVAILAALFLSIGTISAARTPELTRRLPRAADLGLAGMGLSTPEMVEMSRKLAEERSQRPRRRGRARTQGDPSKPVLESTDTATTTDPDTSTSESSS